MGCTEPVSIAYAAARARELLGAEPRHVLIEASGNIIKNVKSVTVPHTGGMKGIEAAAAAGIAAGDASRGLQVIASIAESSFRRSRHIWNGRISRCAVWSQRMCSI